ncbi:MAG TPA: zinc-dependent alcohol dehydrogenase family protein [Gammaproteobacteria bacterium]|nr:zinc-dependent alcohol dehydrogenase family protein [Gammaproteobacteria bacterium]
MHAMQLKQIGKPLEYVELPIPKPEPHEILVKVLACGICRTDLHVIDGDLKNPLLPIIPGHQVLGKIESLGTDVKNFKIGERVGIPWLGGSCGHCDFCLTHQENLCDSAIFTGYQKNGGFAEYCTADSHFCFPIPENYPDIQAAPLLCAGLIGYRAYKKAENAKRIGLYGFGAAAHIVIQIARYRNQEIYAFTRAGDMTTQQFAKELGAVWAGDSESTPPKLLDAAIIFAPIGELVPAALKALRKGGIVVCAGIHMTDIPAFPYDLLWGERSICSIANLTRQDGDEFLALAPKIPIHTKVQVYSLRKANEALDDLRHGRFTGAAVIKLDPFKN